MSTRRLSFGDAGSGLGLGLGLGLGMAAPGLDASFAGDGRERRRSSGGGGGGGGGARRASGGLGLGLPLPLHAPLDEAGESKENAAPAVSPVRGGGNAGGASGHRLDAAAAPAACKPATAAAAATGAPLHPQQHQQQLPGDARGGARKSLSARDAEVIRAVAAERALLEASAFGEGVQQARAPRKSLSKQDADALRSAAAAVFADEARPRAGRKSLGGSDAGLGLGLGFGASHLPEPRPRAHGQSRASLAPQDLRPDAAGAACAASAQQGSGLARAGPRHTWNGRSEENRAALAEWRAKKSSARDEPETQPASPALRRPGALGEPSAESPSPGLAPAPAPGSARKAEAAAQRRTAALELKISKLEREKADLSKEVTSLKRRVEELEDENGKLKKDLNGFWKKLGAEPAKRARRAGVGGVGGGEEGADSGAEPSPDRPRDPSPAAGAAGKAPAKRTEVLIKDLQRGMTSSSLLETLDKLGVGGMSTVRIFKNVSGLRGHVQFDAAEDAERAVEQLLRAGYSASVAQDSPPRPPVAAPGAGHHGAPRPRPVQPGAATAAAANAAAGRKVGWRA